MIAEVVGAVQNPIPAFKITACQARSKDPESSSSKRMHTNPTDISSMPTSSTSRSPSFGRYQNDNPDKMATAP